MINKNARDRRPHLRRQHPLARRRLRLRSGGEPHGGRPLATRSSRRSRRSTAPTASCRSCGRPPRRAASRRGRRASRGATPDPARVASRRAPGPAFSALARRGPCYPPPPLNGPTRNENGHDPEPRARRLRRRPRPLLRPHGARHHGAPRDPRRRHDVRDDGVHPVREPRDPASRRGWPADVRRAAHVHGARRRDRDARDGARLEPPARARVGHGAERRGRVPARRRDEALLRAGDGRHRRRGPRHHRARRDRPAPGGRPGGADGPQAGDRHRHRALPRHHRLQERRVRVGGRRAPHARRARPALRLPRPPLRPHAPLHRLAPREERPRRAPHRHRRCRR